MITGKIHEELYFGRCPWQSSEHKGWFECFKKIIKLRNRGGTLFTNALCEEIAKELGSYNGEIEFYTAIGSPLDIFHGVDGFIVVWLGSKRKNAKIITLDITLKLKKENFKSDFLLTPIVLGKSNYLLTESIVLFIKNYNKNRIFYYYH